MTLSRNPPNQKQGKARSHPKDHFLQGLKNPKVTTKWKAGSLNAKVATAPFRLQTGVRLGSSASGQWTTEGLES